ncbi:MAG: hypothetical protein Kow0090_01030 [Myxococcota bacterium]
MENIPLSAEIKGVKYTPLLSRKLTTFNIKKLKKALTSETAFILRVNSKVQFAVSWWVSAKRTRSYPYARVYDTLGFAGKKVTIIPAFKDEGKKGDRDFLQWDTISLMSLIGVYVIIAYYSDAVKSDRYEGKITNQQFNISHLKYEFDKLVSWQSDALHWNLEQTDKIGKISNKALQSYGRISKRLGIAMHSPDSARRRIEKIGKNKETFLSHSRDLAEKAQKRESVTVQPKEHLSGSKSIITIKNYLGGKYYLTSDEVTVDDENKKIFLLEGKHTRTSSIPSTEDIKDGLLRMILLTNLEDIKIGSKSYKVKPILKLTVEGGFKLENLNESQKALLRILKKEANKNGFALEVS